MAALCVLITLLLSHGLICQPGRPGDDLVPVLTRSTAILHHGGMQQFKHHRFLGTRVSYHGNTCATFQLELLVAGDVNPNPGPEHKPTAVQIVPDCTSARSTRTTNPLVTPAYNYTSQQLRNINCHSTHLRLPSLVCANITALGLNRKRRGKRGGRRPICISNHSSDFNTTHKIPVVSHPNNFSKPTVQGNKRGVCLENLKSVSSSDASLINFCALNARSVVSKVDGFIDFVLSNNLDIVAITETWIKPTDNITITAITPNGYSFLHSPRIDRAGGGVGILFRSGLNVTLKSEMTVYLSFEAIHVEITSHSKTIRLVNVYRPPSKPNVTFGLFLQDFEGMINDYLFLPSDIVFVGDFNIRMDNLNDTNAMWFKTIITILWSS